MRGPAAPGAPEEPLGGDRRGLPEIGLDYGADMRIGAHVRAGKGLVPALQHGDEIGAEVVQIFTQSPRMWKPSQYGPEVLAGYREAQAEHPRVTSTFCHATYLINLASPDPELERQVAGVPQCQPGHGGGHGRRTAWSSISGVTGGAGSTRLCPGSSRP